MHVKAPQRVLTHHEYSLANPVVTSVKVVYARSVAILA